MEVVKFLFFFFFLRGLPQKAPGLQTHSKLMLHTAAETQESFCAQSLGWAPSCYHPPDVFLVFSRSLSPIFNLQGDILTAVRRLDEQWIEAKLGEKVGICPRQLIEVSLLSFSLCFFVRFSVFGSDGAKTCHRRDCIQLSGWMLPYFSAKCLIHH